MIRYTFFAMWTLKLILKNFIFTFVFPAQSMQCPPCPVVSNKFLSKKHRVERPLQSQAKIYSLIFLIKK